MIDQIFLYTHIAAGSLALIFGALAAISQKGRNIHIQTGRLFGVSMAVTAITAVSLSIIRPNPFMLGIGIFTGYLVSSGWIWAMRINVSLRRRYARIIAFPGIAAALFMLWQSWGGDKVNVVLVVFGLILMVMAIPDAIRRKNPDAPIRLHAGRIGGAYIAAFTAFLVVNIEWGLIVWLGPTVVGTPLIFLATNKFEKRRIGKRAAKQAE